jgi:adenosylcobinamide amidohydrolase
MPKPSLIPSPRKTALYLPEQTLEKGKALAAESGLSLSQLVSQLLETQADTLCKVRIHADFSADEHDQVKKEAERLGMSIEDLVRTATYHLLDTKS